MSKQTSNENIYISPAALDYYTTFAKLYDKEENIIKQYYPPNSDQKEILDLGCGGGRIANVLHQMGHKVTGVDLSPDLIKIAQAKFPKLKFVVGDACRLEFPDQSFDDVWFSFNGLDFIHPYPRLQKALSEIHRVIKPGGLFIYSSHNSLCFLTARPSRLTDLARNIVNGGVFRRYRKVINATEGVAYIYHRHPAGQIKQLKKIGYDQCKVYSSYNNKFQCTYSDHWPYYVARKKNE